MDILAILFPSILIIIGLALIVSNTIKNVNKKRRCTILINAECIGLDKFKRHSSNGTSLLYAPIFKYSYNEREYTTIVGDHCSKGYPKVGDYKDIYINPDNPEDTYRIAIDQDIFIILLGLAFIAAGIYVLIKGSI